jgi:hypothetical protein
VVREGVGVVLVEVRAIVGDVLVIPGVGDRLDEVGVLGEAHPATIRVNKNQIAINTDNLFT